MHISIFTFGETIFVSSEMHASVNSLKELERDFWYKCNDECNIINDHTWQLINLVYTFEWQCQHAYLLKEKNLAPLGRRARKQEKKEEVILPVLVK